MFSHDQFCAAWWFRSLQKLSEEVKELYGIELSLDNIKSLPPHMTEYMFSGIVSVNCDKQFEYVCRESNLEQRVETLKLRLQLLTEIVSINSSAV
ncbi:hypothetical protein EB796_000706 [Bugula neritina]|uniref:Uncharacterized protein n=1 Tax=Bugula neritina TaxID=10212 RepID=A0A7J7KS71_BUGNE|nr:hypothetical protein EB796_000706 [Bugula neritina]